MSVHAATAGKMTLLYLKHNLHKHWYCVHMFELKWNNLTNDIPLIDLTRHNTWF